MGTSEIIQKAVELGEPQGEITFEQLNELFSGLQVEPEDIERVMEALRDKGINLVEP